MNKSEVKVEIRSRYTPKTRFSTKSGRKFHNNYEISIDEKGHKTLRKVGETNLYEKIQEYLEDTLIENIIDRVRNGDLDAIKRAESHYLDMTELPTNLAAAQNVIAQLKTEFENLPLDIKKEFNFSPEQYVAEYGNEKWKKVIKAPEPISVPLRESNEVIKEEKGEVKDE